jgi:lysophospholipase L1-like esterase
MIKPFHIACLFLMLVCLLVVVPGIKAAVEPALAVTTNTAVIPAPHADREADVQRKWQRFSGKHFNLVFDGDSIMNRWETTGKEVWNQRYSGIAADFGIEGDRVENVLWRLDHGQVDGIDPKVVVLMIGTNNSGRNSAREIADGIKKLVAEYEERCPQAHIILMAIFPRGEKPDDGGRRKVAAVNALIKSLGDGQRLTFIDIGDKLMESDGTISRDMMPDFVHPTAKGYQIWADAIQPMIDQYVSSK